MIEWWCAPNTPGFYTDCQKLPLGPCWAWFCCIPAGTYWYRVLWCPFAFPGARVFASLTARLDMLLDRVQPISNGPPGAMRWLGYDPRAVAIARADGDVAHLLRLLARRHEDVRALDAVEVEHRPTQYGRPDAPLAVCAQV